MMVGIGLFFGFILGGMTSMLNNLDSQRARYIHHLEVIKDHMVCYIVIGGFITGIRISVFSYISVDFSAISEPFASFQYQF